MKTLENFIIESNKIEGEKTLFNAEPPIYEWFLANDLTEENLKEFHKRLCNARNQLEKKYRGVYRDCVVYIGGFMKLPETVERDMHILFENYTESKNKNIERALAYTDPFSFHKRYEDIHPFADLNGRTGRAVWLHMMDGEAPLGFLHQWYYQSLS